MPYNDNKRGRPVEVVVDEESERQIQENHARYRQQVEATREAARQRAEALGATDDVDEVLAQGAAIRKSRRAY